MAAELFIPPSKALDANANPYAGAKWFFYATGTITPQSVYTTAALSTAHTNPVVADSTGKFANIFFNASLTYRGILKSADESVTLHDIDPISGAALASLAASGGAGLVGIADAGSYYTGTNVELALQEAGAERVAPRPIGTGGTGASTSAAALTNLGITNVGAEVAITSSLTIPNAFPASYVIRDSGSPADYNIFLPAAAAVGAIVYFRVDQTATKLFTLYDSGTQMDGPDRRILWAGETLMLLKTATGWTKIGGQTIPMHGALIRTAAQTLATTGYQSVVFTAGAGNNKSLNYALDTVSNCFKAPRNGVFAFTASLPVQGITVGAETYAGFSFGNGGSPYGIPNAISIQTRETGQSRNTHNISTIFNVTRNQLVGCAVYVTTGTPQLEYVSGTLEIAMTYQEVVTW
jgi:hypothetical protein